MNHTEIPIPHSPDELAEHLKSLHEKRKEELKKLPRPRRRLSLTRDERDSVIAKTAERCHLCGGEVARDKFVADHVRPHAAGGEHALGNYLAAHGLCNGCRWFYSPEEFQWILRMGMWARKQMEDRTRFGDEMLARFVPHEKTARKPRKPRK